MVRQILKSLIKESLGKLQKQNVLSDFAIPEIGIERPADEKNGDYSTNIAMQIAKIMKKPPLEIADEIVSGIPMEDSKVFHGIMAVQPGFINFFLADEFLQNQIGEIFKKDFGKLDIGNGRKVNIEFISANPTGPLHIGNGRGAFFGDALANILEKAGHKIVKEYFINDAKKSNQIKELGRTALGKGETYLDDNLKLMIKKLKAKLKKITNEGEAGHLLSREIQRENQKVIEKKLKIKFDRWISEQKIFDSKKIEGDFEWLKNKNFTYEKEGATWLKTIEFGDEKDWVIIRSDGEPSYLLSDIAYHQDKIERGFDKIIDIWGADHQGHVGKMKAAMKILGYKGDFALQNLGSPRGGKTASEASVRNRRCLREGGRGETHDREFDILISQMVRLKTGKMSKRKGEIVKLEDLIDEVGLDVARFFYLTKSLNSQMEFDLDLAREQSEKNPVYYIQYAHARICSIIKKSKIKSPAFAKASAGKQNLNLLNHPSELKLIKQIIRFPEIIEDTAKDYQVQRLPQYATDLATSFHQFYRDCQVLADDKNLKEARLSLILATKSILKQTLDLMGISAPEKM